MGSQENYEAIPIGMDLGTFEMTLDDETVKKRIELVQWQAKGLAEKGFAPPGLTISHHARMKFEALPEMRVSIWAKSEHEFLKPMKLGSKIFISGKVVDKYVKRGRNYLVTDLETVDEAGEVLLRSRETTVYVE
jgi:acyl dehydratase